MVNTQKNKDKKKTIIRFSVLIIIFLFFISYCISTNRKNSYDPFSINYISNNSTNPNNNTSNTNNIIDRVYNNICAFLDVTNNKK